MVIEILVAVTIITVSILATMTVAQKSVQVSRQSLHSSQAGFLLEEGAEALRTMRDSAWSNISSLVPGTEYYFLWNGSAWTLSETPSTIGEFTRIATVSSVNRDSSTRDIVASGGTDDPDTKLVEIEVSWREGGTLVTKNIQFYLMNIFQ